MLPTCAISALCVGWTVNPSLQERVMPALQFMRKITVLRKALVQVLA